jgi:hypothetical protein
MNILYEIWGSHSSEGVDTGLLGYNTVQTCRQILAFQRNILFQGFSHNDGGNPKCVYLQVHTELQRRRPTIGSINYVSECDTNPSTMPGFNPEDGGSILLWNTGTYLEVHTALQPRRSTSTSTYYVSESDINPKNMHTNTQKEAKLFTILRLLS